MVNKQRRLLDLYSRKEDVVSNMDGFQIAKEIEDAVFDVLTEIFTPHIVTGVYEEGFGHLPDYGIEFEALGKRKNRVFFEIKSGDLLKFELRKLEKMVRELSIVYGERFYSLVVIARSFKDKVEIDNLCEKAYPEKVEFISAETLSTILNVLKEKTEPKERELKDLFLASLLKQTGILPRDYVLTYNFSKLRKMLEIGKEAARLDDQIESTCKLLESAEQTLGYWKEQYSRFIRKKELVEIRQELERELVWAKVNQKKRIFKQWKELLTDVQEIRKDLQAELVSIEVKTYKSEGLRKCMEFLKFQDKKLRKLESKIRPKFEESSTSLDLAREEAMKLGPEIPTEIPLVELEKNMTRIDEELAGLADVSEDVECMYESYKSLFKELEEKAKELEGNRQRFRQLLREELSN